MIDGAGYAYPTFYGDFPMYPIAIVLSRFNCQSEAYEIIYRAGLQIAYFTYFIGTYFLVKGFVRLNRWLQKEVSKSSLSTSELSLIAAVLMIQSPYTLENISVNSIRIFAMQIIPFVLYNYIQLYYRQVKGQQAEDDRNWFINVIGLQLLMWLILQFHLITFMFTVIQLQIITICIIVYNIKKSNNKWSRFVKHLQIQAITCIIQSLYFIVPMLMTMKEKAYTINNIQYNLQSDQNIDIRGLTLPVWLLRIVKAIIYPSYQVAVDGKYTDAYSQSGFYIFYFIIIVIIGVYFIKLKKSKLTFINLGYVAFYMILMFSKINLNILSFMQFRYRLNTVLDVCLVAILMIDIVYIAQQNLKITNTVLKSVLGVSFIQTIICVQFVQVQKVERVEYTTQVGNGGEYLIYNEAYDIPESKASDVVHYQTGLQIVDMLKYKRYFENVASVQQVVGNNFEMNISLSKQKDLNDKYEQILRDRGVRIKRFESLNNKKEFSDICIKHLPLSYYPWYNIEVNGENVEYSYDEMGFIQIITDSSEVQAIDIKYELPIWIKVLGIIQLCQIVAQVSSIGMAIRKIKQRRLS